MEAVPGVYWLITGSNADAGGQICTARMQRFAAEHPDRAGFIQSLGLRRYLSAMQYAALVAGNSSSGVVETPSMGVPAVNIGMRQEGRPICANVVCADAAADGISDAIAKAASPARAAAARGVKSPYDGGDTSGKIVELLARHVREGLLHEPKTFYTLGADGCTF